MKQIFLFIGPSGCGKGTQAKLLIKKLGLEYLETGQLLRNYQKNNNFSGKKLIKVMNRGDFVPSFFVASLWLNELEKIKDIQGIKGLLLDGVCRKLMEAKILDQALNWYEWSEMVKVIFINISKEESILRLTKRRICEGCKKTIFPLENLESNKTCHQCGGRLEIREDDKKESIIKRLENFDKETLPVINFFRKQKKLIEVNGEQSVKDVFEEILIKIKEIKKS